MKPSDSRWEHGVLVRFDERFSDLLHNGDGRDDSKQSWFCHPKDLSIFHDDLIDFTVPDLSELF